MVETMELQRVRSYIGKVYWKTAKTYAKSWPHEYTIRWWRPELDEEFVFVVLYIREHGIEERFYSRKHIYLYLDGLKYWTMGDPLERTWVLNRAKGISNEEEFRLKGMDPRGKPLKRV